MQGCATHCLAGDACITEKGHFFSVEALNVAITELLEDLNARPMRHIGKSRKDLFEQIERTALGPLPDQPFEYAEWKRAKVHPDYHIEVNHSFYSVPHSLIGRMVDVRLSHRMVEIYHQHQRVALHVRRGQKGGHLVIPPFLMGLSRRIHATIFSFIAGDMPPMPMLGRSLL